MKHDTPIGDLKVVTDVSGSSYVAYVPPRTGMLGLDAVMLRESAAVLTALADEVEARDAAVARLPRQESLFPAEELRSA